MQKQIILCVLLALYLTALAFWPRPVAAPKTIENTLEIPIAHAATTTPDRPTVTHQQDVWISVLEWCESRGITTAINREDRDGTPSYFSFQFKPSTFKHYAVKYGFLEKTLTSEQYFEQMREHKVQRSILERMVLDPDVVWTREFPACVAKYGKPPR